MKLTEFLVYVFVVCRGVLSLLAAPSLRLFMPLLGLPNILLMVSQILMYKIYF